MTKELGRKAGLFFCPPPGELLLDEDRRDSQRASLAVEPVGLQANS